MVTNAGQSRGGSLGERSIYVTYSSSSSRHRSGYSLYYLVSTKAVSAVLFGNILFGDYHRSWDQRSRAAALDCGHWSLSARTASFFGSMMRFDAMYRMCTVRATSYCKCNSYLSTCGLLVPYTNVLQCYKSFMFDSSHPLSSLHTSHHSLYRPPHTLSLLAPQIPQSPTAHTRIGS